MSNIIKNKLLLPLVSNTCCLGVEIKFKLINFFKLSTGRMSDQNQPVRLMATHCFATLIQLMPLDGGIPEPQGLTTELVRQKEKERKFLEQLFNPKLIEDYKVPVPIKAELRSYQQVSSTLEGALCVLSSTYYTNFHPDLIFLLIFHNLCEVPGLLCD